MHQKAQDRINTYLLHVAEDSFRTEKRTGVFTAQFAEFNNTILLKFRTNFEKVDRRIIFRLTNNFKKTTGFDIIIDSKIAKQLRDQMDTTPGQLRLSDGSIDPNYTVAFCSLLGKPVTLNYYSKTEQNKSYLNPDFDADPNISILAKKFLAAGSDLAFQNSAGWKEYCRIYREIYGHMPRAQKAVIVHEKIKAEFDFANAQT